MRCLPLFWLGVALAGFAPMSGSAGTTNADQAFERLVDDYLAGYLAWRPQTGTSLGYHQYDGKVTDLSRSSLDAEVARLKAFDRRLASMNPIELGVQSRYDYIILQNAIRREIFSFADQQIYRLNPMTYAGVLDVNIYVKRDFAPLPDRVRSIIAVLNHAPDITAAARANLADSLPRPMIETAIEVASGSADFLKKDLVDALKEVKDEKLMADFAAANRRAIAEIEQYATYLKEQKLPKANENFALGRDKYLKLLEYGEMVRLSPESLLQIGERELRRKQNEFAEDAREIDSTKPPIEVFRSLQNDHPTEQGLIPDTIKGLERIRQFVVDRHLITIPSEVRARVMETPEFMRATSFASMDTPGPFETKATEAYYYVTPPEANWPAAQKEEWLSSFSYCTMDIVSIHEAYPGHYVQFLCLNASPASRLEKIFGSYAYIEGWAHYCEQMVVDQGFGASDAPNPTAAQKIQGARYRLAQTDEALLRICRFCASLRLHCQRMTVAEATKFFEDNCYYEEKPAHAEALRGTFDPEYLYYTLGKLEILKLREDYRKQEGTSFSLQRFNDEMTRHGMPPIRLLREVLLKDSGQWNDTL
jgi:uncharacterized protein (DUF885 family)